eukprot:810738-Prymnesium_polylepis.1
MDSVLLSKHLRVASDLLERARSKLQLDPVASALSLGRSESKFAIGDAESDPSSNEATIGAIQRGSREEASAAACAISRTLAVVESSV